MDAGSRAALARPGGGSQGGGSWRGVAAVWGEAAAIGAARVLNLADTFPPRVKSAASLPGSARNGWALPRLAALPPPGLGVVRGAHGSPAPRLPPSWAPAAWSPGPAVVLEPRGLWKKVWWPGVLGVFRERPKPPARECEVPVIPELRVRIQPGGEQPGSGRWELVQGLGGILWHSAGRVLTVTFRQATRLLMKPWLKCGITPEKVPF